MKTYPTEQIRNVVVAGHGGSGKTMLIEHLLYTAKQTDRLGSISAGTTQSDFDPQEQDKQHSLTLTVNSLEWNDCKINLIDVPGDPDFAGELEAAARIADAMIIVCEAKSDLDVGFDLAWEAAERHGLARCIFINKLERDNADYAGLIDNLDQRYGAKVVSCEIPLGQRGDFNGLVDLLRGKVYKGKDRGDQIEDIPEGMADDVAYRREKMMDAAAEGDDALMEKYLEGQKLTEEEVEHGLMMGIKDGRVVPVFLGSAETGIGMTLLLDRIVGELPPPTYHPVTWGDKKIPEDPNGPLAAYAFKTTSDPYVGRINYIRVFSGTLNRDAEVINSGRGHNEKVHNLYWPHGKNVEECQTVPAGDICVIAKLDNTHAGDTLSGKDEKVLLNPIDFPRPVFRVAIEAASKADEDKLGTAIPRLLEEEPTARFTRDPETHEDILEGLGHIHVENMVDKLKQKFSVTVSTREARIPYRETFTAAAKAQGKFKRQSGGKGQYGDCWIEFEPLPRGEGFEFNNKVVGGAIPRNYIPAVEKGLQETLPDGVVAGYPIVDIKATVVDGSYHDVDSNEQAFKTAARLAFQNAADNAHPVLLEPIMNVEIDVPDDAVGDIMGDLNTRRGQTSGIGQPVPGLSRISAQVPMAHMSRYAVDLRAMTKGRGRFRTEMSHYAEVPHHEAEPLISAYKARRNGDA